MSKSIDPARHGCETHPSRTWSQDDEHSAGHTARPIRLSPSVVRMSAAVLLGVACLGGAPAVGAPPQSPGLTSTNEALHQEIFFRAPPARVYAALTHADQYAQIERLGVAMNAHLNLGDQPTQISEAL